jgi:acetyl-CoA C-acetyltransferase
MMRDLNEVVIIDGVRTPIGTYKGALKSFKADQLGSIVIKELLKRTKIDENAIDEVILGQVLTAGAGQNPARQAAINAGLPKSISAYLVNQVCGSGLRSVISGYHLIRLGESKCVISGGQESMSSSPHSLFYREDRNLSREKLIDTMINDGLMDAFNNYHMGVTAENISNKFKISREDQDLFALNSQKKTQKAIIEKKFHEELIKVKTENIFFEHDEHPRKNLKIEDLNRLKTVFKENGTVTPGNSSGINDGASAVLLTSLDFAEKNSLIPMARIISWASTGVDPSLMGLGPIDAIKISLKKANWKIDDIDLFEINEAFAAQSIAVIQELKIPEQKINVNGGAIALGHPIGASGTRILVTLIHEMIKQNKSKGCAALCIGGGMGIAMCVERN